MCSQPDLPGTPDQLRERILDEKRTVDVLDLVEVLLRVCRRDRSQLNHYRNDPAVWANRATVRLGVNNLFLSQGHYYQPQRLLPSDRERLAEVVANHAHPPEPRPPTPLPVVALGMAQGLDDRVQNGFAACFARRHQHTGEHALGPCEVFPVPHPPLGGQAGQRPPGEEIRHSPYSFDDRLHYVRLAPHESSEFRVVLDVSYFGLLPPLFGINSEPATPHTRFGVGVLNAGFQDFEWEPHQQNGTSFFYNVGALQHQQQVAYFQRVLHSARAQKVDVLILPELWLRVPTPDHLQGADPLRPLLDQVQSNPSHLGPVQLFVAGSRHIMRSQVRRNECTAVLCALPNSRLTHFKFSPYSFRDVQGTVRWEAIHAERTLRVYLGPDWSLSLLICRDFLHPDAQNWLLQLGVTFIVVPAFSSQTGAFIDWGNLLSQYTQSFVAIANNPIFTRDDGQRDNQALFMTPSQRHNARQRSSLPRRMFPPALAIFEINSGNVRWRSC